MLVCIKDLDKVFNGIGILIVQTIALMSVRSTRGVSITGDFKNMGMATHVVEVTSLLRNGKIFCRVDYNELPCSNVIADVIDKVVIVVGMVLAISQALVSSVDLPKVTGNVRLLHLGVLLGSNRWGGIYLPPVSLRSCFGIIHLYRYISRYVNTVDPVLGNARIII